MVEVEPTDILDAVRKYSSERSVLDEATSISIDFSLLDIEAIKAVIEKQGGLKSRQGLEIEPSQGEGDDIDIGDKPDNKDEPDKEKKESKNSKNDEKIDYKGKFAMYYARILFLSFLTDSKVISLQEIIDTINDDESNLRIALNLNLEIDILTLFQEHINPFVLSELDYKISNINSLANDSEISPIERASNAMKKFSRLSYSEIVTPESIANKIINALPLNTINDSTLICDIASKQGEFVYAIYKKYGKEIANNFYSIPTSKIAYEFTRKVYNLLQLNLENIESNYTSYDLIEENDLLEDKTIKINNNDMKFDVIVGNPPYQEPTKDTSDNPIYNYFIDKAYKLADKVVLIHPARFLFNAGKTSKKWNQKMLNDKNIKVVYYEQKSFDVFSDTDIKGGIAITYRDKNTNFGKIGVFTSYPELNLIRKKVEDNNNFKPISEIIFLQNKFDLNKLYSHNPNLKTKIGSNGKERRLTSPIFSQIDIFTDEKVNGNDVRIFGLIRNKRVFKWMPKELLDEHPNLNKYKVLVPKANGSGALGEILSTPIICEPNTGFTFSFISFGDFDDINDAKAMLKYLKTKFARTLLGVLKITQDNLPRTWSKVPIQNFTSKSDIDWSKSIEEIDQQLYAKYKLSKEEIEFIDKMIKPM